MVVHGIGGVHVRFWAVGLGVHAVSQLLYLIEFEPLTVKMLKFMIEHLPVKMTLRQHRVQNMVVFVERSGIDLALLDTTKSAHGARTIPPTMLLIAYLPSILDMTSSALSTLTWVSS